MADREDRFTALIDAVEVTAGRPDPLVIDLGCGSGIFTYLLNQRGYDAAGLDISPKLLELARRKYPDLPEVEVVVFRFAVGGAAGGDDGGGLEWRRDGIGRGAPDQP